MLQSQMSKTPPAWTWHCFEFLFSVIRACFVLRVSDFGFPLLPARPSASAKNLRGWRRNRRLVIRGAPLHGLEMIGPAKPMPVWADGFHGVGKMKRSKCSHQRVRPGHRHMRADRGQSYWLTRWLFANSILGGILALTWLILRSGSKPSRFAKKPVWVVPYGTSTRL